MDPPPNNLAVSFVVLEISLVLFNNLFSGVAKPESSLEHEIKKTVKANETKKFFIKYKIY
jgi:hypothetical protein